MGNCICLLSEADPVAAIPYISANIFTERERERERESLCLQ
jgi:hypothetical protein